MARLTWDNTGDRLYETGVKMGVLYPLQSDGVCCKLIIPGIGNKNP